MNIHEYQAKEVFRRYGIPVPKGIALEKPEDAAAAFEELGTPICAVKAQIHAGGRGKAGGVKLAKSAAEAVEMAKAMWGMTLVTHQTGPEGREVRKVYVEAGSDIDREMYLAIAVDRESQRPVLMASAEGGMDIEELAESRPDAIVRVPIHPSKGMLPFQLRQVCFALGITDKAQQKSAAKLIGGVAKAFSELDCSLLEINPLITTKGGEVVALDAKMNFDSNALFRHPDIVAYRDEHEEDPKEVEAGKFGLNYIALDGTIGCMVNGAGLAMATMDVIQLKGGSPANFLDVGGGANKEQVTNAFKIILSDPNVQGVLVNIFGGIMKCDIIAEGVIAAAKEVDLNVPLVVRLEGTNVQKGRELLEGSGIALETASSLDEAAEKIVALAAAK